MEKKYWKGLDELNNEAEFVKQNQNEFAESIPKVLTQESLESNTQRRDFLKILGFGIGVATLASCEAPVRKTIPYLIKPEEVNPGEANWYASTFADGSEYSSILVKTRDGRPIKIEGNTLSSVTKGGTSARVQASVLSVYDSTRLKGPKAGKNDISWEDADKQISQKLSDIAAKNGKIAILSASIISPSTQSVINDFISKYPGSKHITYDAVSVSGIRAANKESFDMEVIPSYLFNKAEVIVSLGADFLSTWISPVEFASQYAENRKLRNKNTMSKHIQFESTLSLSGSNADERYTHKPSELGSVLLNLYNKIASQTGGPSLQAPACRLSEAVNKTAQELLAAKGKSLVICGSNDPSAQMIVNAINSLLGNYGNTINLDSPVYINQGDDAALATLVEGMKKGEYAGLILYKCNPLYSYPNTNDFNEGLKKVGLKISFSEKWNESSDMMDYSCPDHNFLESWNDAEPKAGHYSLAQPVIAPLFNTRQAQESLLKWSGNTSDFQTYIQQYWKANFFSRQEKFATNEDFWVQSLQDGVFEMASAESKSYQSKGDVNAAAAKLSKMTSADLELVLYVKTGIGNGEHAGNPWLQELPDPISKVCWDNYASISPQTAEKLNLVQTQVINIESNGKTIKLPVFIQPGQANSTVAIALGYGRSIGKEGKIIGVNAYPMAGISNASLVFSGSAVNVTKTSDENYTLASTQTHHTMMGREPVRETTLAEFVKDPKAGNPLELITTANGKKRPEELDIWATASNPGFEKPNHKWGLGIDLNACIGCGACVVSCSAENNVPVVGKDEISRTREMHWIRIDRYYSSAAAETDRIGLESPTADPDKLEVVFQPVMCQHCNHAPCETVCPVAATMHSSEGLNQMAYNRCIGTRYCANNCPYKVRRFNWFKYSDNNMFDYQMNDDLGKMVLNPDVVVRSRGVMEKCSMCVQRIQAGKLKAKIGGRRPADGEIQTACAQSCPTHAITFGDFNDTASAVGSDLKAPRSYYLLYELDTQPSVFYQTKVRNKAKEAKSEA